MPSPSEYYVDNSPTRRRHTPVLNNWHFNLKVPWSKTPSEITRKLKIKVWQFGRDICEVFRLIVGEFLTTCPTPGKKHLSEIARKIVLTYPVIQRCC